MSLFWCKKPRTVSSREQRCLKVIHNKPNLRIFASGRATLVAVMKAAELRDRDDLPV